MTFLYRSIYVLIAKYSYIAEHKGSTLGVSKLIVGPLYNVSAVCKKRRAVIRNMCVIVFLTITKMYAQKVVSLYIDMLYKNERDFLDISKENFSAQTHYSICIYIY